MNPKRNNNRGITIFYAVFTALATVVLGLAITQMLGFTSRQANYLSNMDRTFRLAETGMNNAIGALTRVGFSAAMAQNQKQSFPADGGWEEWYRNTIKEITKPFRCYYIKTEARRERGAQCYSSVLHSYVETSNVGEYAAAVNDDCWLLQGTQFGDESKIYGLSLRFDNNTSVGRAQYIGSVNPPLNSKKYAANDLPAPDPSSSGFYSYKAQHILIGKHPDYELPQQLPAPLLLPQVTQADLDFYKLLAGPHTTVSDFTNYSAVYPPGYFGFTTNNAGDLYAAHTTQNRHHVYYSANTIKIGHQNDIANPEAAMTKIYGQVLFVSEKNIELHGSVVSADSAVFGSPSVSLPGTGRPDASTAHQGVFITPGDIVITDTFVDMTPNSYGFDFDGDGTVDPDSHYQVIEGFYIAPNGTIQPTSYETRAPTQYHLIHSQLLYFYFKGSWILNTTLATPDMKTVFGGYRSYQYMPSLKDKPPPYIPSLATILYTLEEVKDCGEVIGSASPSP